MPRKIEFKMNDAETAREKKRQHAENWVLSASPSRFVTVSRVSTPTLENQNTHDTMSTEASDQDKFVASQRLNIETNALVRFLTSLCLCFAVCSSCFAVLCSKTEFKRFPLCLLQSLGWSFGFNSTLPGSVINLSDTQRSAMFYVSANTGLIHDRISGKQHLLQGHCNPIRAAAVSSDNRLLVTADAGPESMVVVWDSVTAAPLATLLEPHPNGVVAIDITPDSAFILTLSNDYPQTVAVWDWASGRKEPVATAKLSTEYEFQHFIRFNPADVRDIISNGQKQVVFWVWTGAAIKPFVPHKSGLEKLKKSFGHMTQSAFIPYSSRVVTATTSGEVVLWDYASADPESPEASGREAVKVIRLALHGGINFISTIGQYVVTGGSDGAVRFFDVQFRIVSWLEDLQAGEITSVSFTKTHIEAPAVSNTPLDYLKGVNVPDFIVATMSGKILNVASRVLADSNPDRRRGDLILTGFDADVTAVATHPTRAQFMVGLASGGVQLWSIADKRLLLQHRMPAPPSSRLLQGDNSGPKGGPASEAAEAARLKEERDARDAVWIRSVKFSPDGNIVAFGFQNGALKLFSLTGPGTPSLSEIVVFRHSHGAIFEVCFSPCGQYVATADADRCVALYRFNHRDEDPSKPKEWTYLGRNRAHAKKITNLYFGSLRAAQDPHYQYLKRVSDQKTAALIVQQQRRRGAAAQVAAALAANTDASAPDVPVLISVGEDRMLHRYEVAHASVFNGLKVVASSKVEQAALPLGVWVDAAPAPQQRRRRSDSPINQLHELNDTQGNSSLDPHAQAAALALAQNGVGAGGPSLDLSNYIVVANSEFKLKLWQYDVSMIQSISPPENTEEGADGAGGAGDDSNTTLAKEPVPPTIVPATPQCVRTALGPTFGVPVRSLIAVPRAPRVNENEEDDEEDEENDGRAVKFLAYSTGNKVVGLMKLGLDGNPSKSMGVIAHPGAVSAMALSHDGRFMITAGGADRSVNLWNVNVDALDAAVALAPPEFDSFTSLLDGGRGGPFYEQIVDYFYYCQLRAQGEDSPDAREISGRVHLDQAIALMRALGFYPSQEQIRDICAEVKHALQVRRNKEAWLRAGGVDVESFAPQWEHEPDAERYVGFEQLVRLFVNHRPVFHVAKDNIREAFRVLAGESATMTRDQLLTKLQTLGEKMSESELVICFQSLLGDASLLQTLPPNFTADNFAMDLLGFEDYERDTRSAAANH
jgi:WD40 repeat protein